MASLTLNASERNWNEKEKSFLRQIIAQSV